MNRLWLALLPLLYALPAALPADEKSSVAEAKASAAAPAPAPAEDAYALPAERLAARQLLSEVLGAPGKKTVRGVKSVWVDVVVQKRAEDSAAFTTLEEDLRLSAMEGQLRKAGVKVLQEGKKSIGLSAKPTLVLMVLYAPAHSVSHNPKPFYLVLTCAKQDTARLGEDRKPLVTWAHVGKPIASDGDDSKDADQIRVQAKEGVQAFLDAAKDGE